MSTSNNLESVSEKRKRGRPADPLRIMADFVTPELGNRGNLNTVYWCRFMGAVTDHPEGIQKFAMGATKAEIMAGANHARRFRTVAVSMRYDRIDGFWHTLAHELSHVRHRDGSSVDVDLVGVPRSDVAEKPKFEKRADDEASEFLICRATLDSFIVRHKPRFSKSKIVQFANRHQIHPGIVVGQLQFRKAIPYTHSREMLVPVRDSLTETALTDGWGHFTSY